MNRASDLTDSLEQTLGDPGLQDSAAALAEVVLDSALDPGVTKDIPIIGTVVALSRASVAIRDRLFFKKLLHFLQELDAVPPEKRQQMIRKVNESARERVRVGEKLLYLLERCDDHQTSQLLAILFKAFLQEQVSYDEFLRLAHAVDRVMLADLMQFVKDYWDSSSEKSAIALLPSGLVELVPMYIRVEDQWDPDRYHEKYNVEGGDFEVGVSAIGKKMREILRADQGGGTEQSPPAYPEGRADAPSGSAEP
jgi:hypothetical protein